MPSISSLESKIGAVLACSIDDTSADAMAGRALLSEIQINMVRFKGDVETREQAERRIIADSISGINHRSCSSCLALSAVL